MDNTENTEKLNQEETVVSQPESKQEDTGNTKTKKSPPKLDPQLEQILQESQPEEKLSKVIHLMESALAQKGAANFKLFWEARKTCLDLFKEKISPGVRALYWGKFTELTAEAKRLKELLEEQTAFAVEQIDIAIKALEKERGDFQERVSAAPDQKLPSDVPSLKEHYHDYCRIQKELNLLNVQASRINALRKELIKTEMRIRQKNQFFQRLSGIGDKVFPRRKELIKKNSQQFIEDIDAFVKKNFSEETISGTLFVLQDEIKQLQSIAKIITLNTHSFGYTRRHLSECWDKLKIIEKERKKIKSEQKQQFDENMSSVQEKITQLKQAIEKGEQTIAEAKKQVTEINTFMRTLQLGRDQVRQLKGEINEAMKPLLDKEKEEEKRRKEQKQAREQQRAESIQSIEATLINLPEEIDAKDSQEVKKKIEELESKIKELALSGVEYDGIETHLYKVQNALAAKDESALLKESQDVSTLKKVIKSKRKRLSASKERVEKYRKLCGGSGLDFQQSLHYHEQLTVEKEVVDRIANEIEELEQKLQS